MATGSAIRMLGRMSKQADEVLESGAKIMTKGNLIKNTTNTLSSNLTARQAKTMANAGKEAVQNVRNAPLKEAQNIVNYRGTQRAINAMDEVAATSTYVRNGGSRGRGGNRGYNNRANYRNNNRRVNFNQNQGNRSINMGRNKDEIIKQFNANRTQQAVNNMNKNIELSNTVHNINQQKPRNRRTANIGNDVNYIRFRDLDEAIGTDSHVRSRRAPWTANPVNRRTANVGDDVENIRFRNLGDTNTNARTSPWSDNIVQQEQVISQEPDIFNTYSGMPISNQGPINTNTMNNSLDVRINGQQIDNTNLNTNGPNVNQQSGPNVNQQSGPMPEPEQPKFQGNTTQGNTLEPQFDLGNSTPETVDPLDNQTRPKLGEGVDWSGIGGKAKEFFTGGFTDTYANYKANGGNFTEAVKSAYQNDDGSLRMGRIAGSYMAAAAGVRILSGGGVTKDRNGNNNLIGVPFI